MRPFTRYLDLDIKKVKSVYNQIYETIFLPIEHINSSAIYTDPDTQEKFLILTNYARPQWFEWDGFFVSMISLSYIIWFESSLIIEDPQIKCIGQYHTYNNGTITYKYYVNYQE